MAEPLRIDADRLDDWITGHGGQDRHDDRRDPDEDDEEEEWTHETGGGPVG